MTGAEPQGSSSSGDLEADWNNCLGVVQCGNLALIRSLQSQVAHLTGYADGLKRGSDLHEQRRGELEKQVAELSKHDVCTDRLITTLRERDEARAKVAAMQAVVEYLQRMGRQALDLIHDRNCAGAEIILRNDLADQRARLGDAADVPADHAVPAASTTREEADKG